MPQFLGAVKVWEKEGSWYYLKQIPHGNCGLLSAYDTCL